MEESKRAELTPHQRGVVDEIKRWLADPNGDPLKTLPGYAGTGKTFCVNQLLRETKDKLCGESLCVVGVAPTHSAVKVLAEATRGRFDYTKTIHSFLGLIPNLALWDDSHNARLETLLATRESFRERREEVPKHIEFSIERLLRQRQLSESNKILFSPKSTAVDGRISEVRLLIVDESSMVAADLFSYFCDLLSTLEWCDNGIHPQLRVLFLGDPAQLPPVGEAKAKAFEVSMFPILKDVVRHRGNILDYCTRIREGGNLRTSHQSLIDSEEDFISISYHDAIEGAVDLLGGGEEVRFLSAWNEAVIRINSALVCKLKGIRRPIYSVGDLIRTRGPVCHSYFRGKTNCRLQRKANILAPSNSLLRIVNTEEERKIPLEGMTFTRQEVYCEDVYTGEILEEPLLLVDPAYQQLYEMKCKELFARKRVFDSKSTRNPRGQVGEGAKKYWEKEGLESWYKWKGGGEVTPTAYRELRNRAVAEAMEVYTFSDLVSFHYASTIHQAQGQTIGTVVLDFLSIVNSRGEEGSQWDPRRLLYTAATRAAEQLVLITS